MSVVVKVGATLTGGTDKTLSFSGMPLAGKSSFVAPGSTRLAPRTVDFLTNVPVTTKTDAGVARGGLKVTFSDRLVEEGCCTVQAGSVIIDVGVRWSLNQPESLVDEAIQYLQGLVFTQAFIDSVKKGVVPTT